MKKLGEVDLPLHAGKCPKPVFDSITKATQSFLEVFLSWHSPQLFLKYLGHPLWLQSFGAFLGFDWHSSGLTTVLLSALQKAGSRLKPQKVFVCGGKKRSRYTLQDIAEIGEKEGISLDLVLKLQKNKSPDSQDRLCASARFSPDLCTLCGLYSKRRVGSYSAGNEHTKKECQKISLELGTRRLLFF